MILSEEYAFQIAEIEKICHKNPWSEQAVKESFEKNYIFFGDKKDGKLISCISLYWYHKEAYIGNLSVLPDYRRKGYAENLIIEAIEYSKNKFDFLSLEVRESNKPAIKLYEKTDFEYQGTRPNFYENPTENAKIYTIYL